MTDFGFLFAKGELVPSVVQDAQTGAVLMLAYMNIESLRLSVETGFAWFWSRERGRLWKKGEESGNVLKITEMFYDCDADALLVKAYPAGPACHTGEVSCFHNRLL